MVLRQMRRFRNLMFAVIVGGVGVGVAGVTPAVAAPVVFTDEAAFNAALAGMAMRQDGFEGLASGYRQPIERNGFKVSGDAPNPNLSVFVDAQWATEGINSLMALSLPVTFEFDQAVRAFSIGLIDSFAFAPASFTLSVNGGAAQTLFDMPDYVAPPARVIQFLGVLDLDGMDSLALSSFYHINPGQEAGLIRMDRMRYEDVSAQPVPEPATMLLLGAGLVGVARVRKTRR